MEGSTLAPADSIHIGIRRTSAIVERLHELHPGAGVWPSEPRARARARALVAEFHSGYAGLRAAMPMNIRSRHHRRGMNPAVQAEIGRLCGRWQATHAEFGGEGPFLFGPTAPPMGASRRSPAASPPTVSRCPARPRTTNKCRGRTVHALRLYHDQALFKEPGGGITPWHQDQHYWPLDTARTITLWMPLVDINENMGMMQFASGAHVIGRIAKADISDASQAFYETYVAEGAFPISRERTARAGDASFHTGWAHRAPSNTSTTRRDVMTVIYYAAGRGPIGLRIRRLGPRSPRSAHESSCVGHANAQESLMRLPCLGVGHRLDIRPARRRQRQHIEFHGFSAASDPTPIPRLQSAPQPA